MGGGDFLADTRCLQAQVRRIALQRGLVERQGLRPPAAPLQEGAIGGDGDLGGVLAGGHCLEVGLGLVVPAGALEQVRLADLAEIVDAGVAAQLRADRGTLHVAHRGRHPRAQQGRRRAVREADAVTGELGLGDLALALPQGGHDLDQPAEALAGLRHGRAMGGQQRRLLDVARGQGRDEGALRHGRIVAALGARQFQEPGRIAVAAFLQRGAAGQEHAVGAVGRHGRAQRLLLRGSGGSAAGQQDQRGGEGKQQGTTHPTTLGARAVRRKLAVVTAEQQSPTCSGSSARPRPAASSSRCSATDP